MIIEGSVAGNITNRRNSGREERLMDESSAMTREDVYERLLEARQKILTRERRSVHSPFVTIEATMTGVRIERRRHGADRDWDGIELSATPASPSWEMTFYEIVDGSTMQLGARPCAPRPYDYDSHTALEEAWDELAPDGRILEEPFRDVALDLMWDWVAMLLVVVR